MWSVREIRDDNRHDEFRGVEPGRLGTPMMFPLRPLLVLGLMMVPFSFFANPPGWVWALMFAPDNVRLCPPQPERVVDRRRDDQIVRDGAGRSQRDGTGSGGARKFSA